MLGLAAADHGPPPGVPALMTELHTALSTGTQPTEGRKLPRSAWATLLSKGDRYLRFCTAERSVHLKRRYIVPKHSGTICLGMGQWKKKSAG